MANSSAATCAAAALLLLLLAVASATAVPQESIQVDPMVPKASFNCGRAIKTFLLCFPQKDWMRFFTGQVKLQPECCELLEVYVEKCARKKLPYRESLAYLRDISCDSRFSAAPAPQPAAAAA